MKKWHPYCGDLVRLLSWKLTLGFNVFPQVSKGSKDGGSESFSNWHLLSTKCLHSIHQETWLGFWHTNYCPHTMNKGGFGLSHKLLPILRSWQQEFSSQLHQLCTHVAPSTPELHPPERRIGPLGFCLPRGLWFTKLGIVRLYFTCSKYYTNNK